MSRPLSIRIIATYYFIEIDLGTIFWHKIATYSTGGKNKVWAKNLQLCLWGSKTGDSQRWL